MSDNRLTWWDNATSKHVGFVALDSSEPFRVAIEAHQAPLDPSQPATMYQGGGFVTKGPFAPFVPFVPSESLLPSMPPVSSVPHPAGG
jgi:hypothetical protein